MNNKSIQFHHGGVRQGKWNIVSEISPDPHPFDFGQLAKVGTDEVFEFVTMRRAELGRTRALFNDERSCDATIDYVDPSLPDHRVVAKVVFYDANPGVIANADATVTVDDRVANFEVEFLLVPENRFERATPRRLFQDVDEDVVIPPYRRHIMRHLPRPGQQVESHAIAFSFPSLSAETDWPDGMAPLKSLSVLLIRTMNRWAIDRDLARIGKRPKRSRGAE